MRNNHYSKFAAMLLASFFIMYGVMFLNVAELSHIYLSATHSYMTLLMVSPMALLMLLLMPKMYPNKKANRTIMFVSVLVFVLSLTFLRNQSFIKDEQYMKAMIPHHLSAILTSQQANIKDPMVRKLADGIIEAQKREIALMKEYLQRLKETRDQ